MFSSYCVVIMQDVLGEKTDRMMSLAVDFSSLFAAQLYRIHLKFLSCVSFLKKNWQNASFAGLSGTRMGAFFLFLLRCC